MTEIFANISDEVANFLNNATNYYKNTFTEEEIDFLQFYFHTRMEMMK